MQFLEALIAEHISAAWICLILAFGVLARSADLFVDSSVSLANRFRIPRLVIGIVLVSLATTAPELSVSLMSALHGKPEMALGNAVGSVICNKGLGLALCALIAGTAIPVIPHVLNTSGSFLLFVSLLAFGAVLPDCTLGRFEGLILVGLFFGYLAFLFRQHRIGRFHDDVDMEAASDHLHVSGPRLVFLFLIGLAGIIVSSRVVILSATSIAVWIGIPEAVIALTLVALGTSIPEVATCVSAARKKEGALAVGNILGANIMNICWVAGFSAVVNPLSLERRELLFMFPAMCIILVVSLAMLRMGYRLTRRQGIVLLALYAAYLVSFFIVFPPQV